MKALGKAFVLAAAVAVGASSGGAEAASPFSDAQRALGRQPQAQGEVQLGFYKEAKFIDLMYRGFLGRQASQAEVAGWRRQVDQGASANDLVAAFMRSDEFFVRQLYLGLFQREPDAAGLQSFTESLRGGKSRASVLDFMLRSPEFQQRMK